MTKAVIVGGQPMPSMGLGLWKIDRNEAARVVSEAIEIGFRHLDSAPDYGNEDEVGRGIAYAITSNGCRREDLWITSKLWNTFHRPKHVRPACERSLRDLGVNYLDLYLIHFPIALKFVPFARRYPPGWIFDPEATEPKMEIDRVPLSDTWRAMEELVEAGLVHQIGICNYSSGLLNDLMAYARIKPSVLQIESHPFLTQERLLRLAASYGIKITAYSPLGASSYVSLGMAAVEDSVLTHPVVTAAAKRTGRTAAQIVLRWGLQRGTSVIAKTNRAERLKENLALFDFELEPEDMSAISGLNRNRRFNDPAVFCEQAFGRFYPIYD